MQIKSILNRVQLHSGFVYGSNRLVEKAARLFLEIEIRPHKGSRPVCSGFGMPDSGYDTLPMRRFEFVPLWGIAVFFLYRMRRVACPRCGVKVERIPWAQGKNHLTTTHLCLVSCKMGQTPFLEIGCRCLPDLMGQCLSRREHGCCLGSCQP